MAQTYVLAAEIAAHLHFATKVAEQLSLTSKNAHAVSARAGQQAAGFRAITTFIEDLASSTIAQARQISQDAVAISALATHRERNSRALQQFRAVQNSAADAPYITTLDSPIAQTEAVLRKLDEAFRSRLWRLKSQLEESQQQIRAAAIISSTSKVEASVAGQFKTQLDVIAENIANAAEQIKYHLQQAQRLLSDAIDAR